MQHFDFDLIVIGSGAGGNVGAHYAASIGKKVAIVEREDIGGECPNWGCVPTKALLTAAEVLATIKHSSDFGITVKDYSIDYTKVKQWKDLVLSRTGASEGEKIFKDDGIKLLKGAAKFISKHQITVDDKTYSAKKFLIATGSSTFIPPIEGLKETGFITFKEATDYTNLPKSLFILGGGPIGLEFAWIFSTFGVAVTVADTVDRLLTKEDPETSELVKALMENNGVKILTDVDITKVEKKNNKKVIHYQLADRSHTLEAEEIMIATGKRPSLDFAPEAAQIKIDNNHLVVNKHLQTSQPHIYAAGDVIGPFLFTHTGYYQSYIAVHNAFSTIKIKPSYKVVPRCIYLNPEVASVGYSETTAKEQGITIKKGLSPISILGRANTSNQFNGFVKVITDKHETIIGAAIIAPRAGEMIHELALAIELKVKASVVANLIHAYPTFSEAIKIACSNLE